MLRKSPSSDLTANPKRMRVATIGLLLFLIGIGLAVGYGDWRLAVYGLLAFIGAVALEALRPR